LFYTFVTFFFPGTRANLVSFTGGHIASIDSFAFDGLEVDNLQFSGDQDLHLPGNSLSGLLPLNPGRQTWIDFSSLAKLEVDTFAFAGLNWTEGGIRITQCEEVTTFPKLSFTEMQIPQVIISGNNLSGFHKLALGHIRHPAYIGSITIESNQLECFCELKDLSRTLERESTVTNTVWSLECLTENNEPFQVQSNSTFDCVKHASPFAHSVAPTTALCWQTLTLGFMLAVILSCTSRISYET